MAMVGGFNFDRSKFNRATQAYRQVGSAFKPFVYTAAIDSGYTPVTMLMDTPVSFPGGAGQPPYTPLNYDRAFEGPITLRRALEQSRNVPAVRVMDQLGAKQVISYARRLGLESPLPPYLAVALGAAEATLLEMTSAYSVYPNQGVRMRPYSILKVTDREGNVLEENRPEAKDAIRADTAFVMTNLLRGVVQRGTGSKAAALNWPIGGKTGTTDDYTDAWFIGFDPDITIGVWAGYDQKRTMGPAGTGSESAVPMWNDIMKAWIADAEGSAHVRASRQHRVRVGGPRLRHRGRRRLAWRDHRSVHFGHAAGVGLQAISAARLPLAVSRDAEKIRTSSSVSPARLAVACGVVMSALTSRRIQPSDSSSSSSTTCPPRLHMACPAGNSAFQRFLVEASQELQPRTEIYNLKSTI